MGWRIEQVWTGRQLLHACGHDNNPRYLIRDRDAIYGIRCRRQAQILEIEEVVTAPGSPWQNACAERIIGSTRRECVDHAVVPGERHLNRYVSEYADYYNGVRTRLSLYKKMARAVVTSSRKNGGGSCHSYVPACCIMNTVASPPGNYADDFLGAAAVYPYLREVLLLLSGG